MKHICKVIGGNSSPPGRSFCATFFSLALTVTAVEVYRKSVYGSYATMQYGSHSRSTIICTGG